MIKKLLAFIYILLTVTTVTGESAYVAVHLPKGISIDIPRNWTSLSNDEKIDIAASQAVFEGVIDLENEFEILHFAANYHNREGETEALVNLRYYPDSKLSQKDIEEDVYDLIMAVADIQNEDIMRKALGKAGLRIIEWKGVRKETIGGLTAIVTEYRRSGYSGAPGRVRLMMFNNGRSSFHMTVSYDDNKHNSFMLKAITNKIINSLRVSGY